MGMEEKNKTEQTSAHGNENEHTAVYYLRVEDRETLLFLEVL